METLYINNNQIHDIPLGLFANSFFLKYLYVANNKLTLEFLEAISSYLPWLWALDMSGNVVNYLPYKIMSSFPNMQTFTLCNAHVSHIDNNAFARATDLTVVDLSGNDLTDIKREIFQIIPNIGTIGISGNHFECTCGTKQFQDWLDETGVTLRDVTYCTLNGTAYNIQFADLDWLCSADPPEPIPVCGPLSNIQAGVAIIGETSAAIQWKVYDVQFPPNAQLITSFRKFGGEEYWSEIENNMTKHILANLTQGSHYIFCIFEIHCFLRDCVDFGTISTEPSSFPVVDDCQDVALAVGMTSLGFCFMLAIIVIVFMLVIMRKSNCFSSSSEKVDLSKENGHGYPESFQPTKSYSSPFIPDSPSAPAETAEYETIPAEVPNLLPDKKPFKSNIQRQSLPKTPDEEKLKVAQSPKGKRKSPHLTTEMLMGEHMKAFSRPKTAEFSTAPGNIPDLPQKKTQLQDRRKRSSDSLGDKIPKYSRSMKGKKPEPPTQEPVDYSPDMYLEPVHGDAIPMKTMDSATRERNDSVPPPITILPPGAPPENNLYNDPEEQFMYENDC